MDAMDETREPKQQQKQFDWPRAQQRAALNGCRLPEMYVEKKRVSEGMAMGVLRAIDSFGRECWAAVKTIAARSGYQQRHVARAIKALVALSLITRERKLNPAGVVTNHYRLVWSEIALLAEPTKLPQGHVGPTDQTALGADQTAPGTDQTALGTVATAPGTYKALNVNKKQEETTTTTRAHAIEGEVVVVVELDSFGAEKPATAVATPRANSAPVVREAPDESCLRTAENSATAVAQPANSADWREAVRQLRAVGLRATDLLVAEARCRGVGPQQVAAACGFFAEHGLAWARDGTPYPGVLLAWVRRFDPEADDPADWRLWPTPSKPYQDRLKEAKVDVAYARAKGCPDEFTRGVLAKRGQPWPGNW